MTDLSRMTENNLASLAEARAAHPTMHLQDEDCAGLLNEHDSCAVCGVYHGGECPECGGNGFHKPICTEYDKC